MTTRRRAAIDRAFLQGFLLGYSAGQAETTQELRAELEERAEKIRVKAFRIIDQTRREIGLPDDPELADTRSRVVQ